MKKDRISIDARRFTDFLLSQVPKFDKMILEDIRITDGWIALPPIWWTAREAVRKIVEGAAFVPSEPPAEERSCECGRFDSVYPNMNKDWEPYKPPNDWVKIPIP